MILSVPSHGLLIQWALGKLHFCEKKSILVAETVSSFTALFAHLVEAGG